MLPRSMFFVHTQKQLNYPHWAHWLRNALWAAALSMISLTALAQGDAAAVAPDTLGGRMTVVLATIAVVVICVGVHYEALSFLTGALKRIHIPLRARILFLIFAILATHVVEIWIFGGAYYWLSTGEGQGALVATHPLGILDHIYFSAVCFSTLGLGDIVPMGAIRFLTGTEALTGFVLITWSASFTYVEMERFWRG